MIIIRISTSCGMQVQLANIFSQIINFLLVKFTAPEVASVLVLRKKKIYKIISKAIIKCLPCYVAITHRPWIRFVSLHLGKNYYQDLEGVKC